MAHKTEAAVEMLKKLISIPSVTFDEEKAADYLYEYLTNEAKQQGNAFNALRIANNVAAIGVNYDAALPTLMLNAHCDTVSPAASYTLPPFEATENDGIIYGLGSNDDGGSVVCLTQAFLHFNALSAQNGDAKMNIILLISAEEERSGEKGIVYALQELQNRGISPDFAIIGEPTGMQAAVAERGLLVLDGTATGVSGHAARNEGVNAIYKALEDIQKLRNFNFEKKSELMGDVKLSVTQINAGTAHNVIPDKCSFVVDIRPTEQYSNQQIWELLQNEVESELKPRNLKNKTSATPYGHKLLVATEKCGIEKFVSPTTSDWMKIDIPAIKIGPGDSSRSHKADEYIKIEEIQNGITTYIKFINNI
ncbi:MAG: M20/M25/M40 family metallo-hydrolase [Bacteroidales bacterium]|nr:M20/M25/M40 family metallo-hydrolase [Bacteroidales bacterium]